MQNGNILTDNKNDSYYYFYFFGNQGRDAAGSG